jgi:hypothetical protein
MRQPSLLRSDPRFKLLISRRISVSPEVSQNHVCLGKWHRALDHTLDPIQVLLTLQVRLRGLPDVAPGRSLERLNLHSGSSFCLDTAKFRFVAQRNQNCAICTKTHFVRCHKLTSSFAGKHKERSARRFVKTVGSTNLFPERVRPNSEQPAMRQNIILTQ